MLDFTVAMDNYQSPKEFSTAFIMFIGSLTALPDYNILYKGKSVYKYYSQLRRAATLVRGRTREQRP